MKILKKYIEQELEARILVTKRFSSSRDTGRNVTENKKKVHFKEEAFPGMNEAFNKMKEITESLKEQKLETRKQAQGEKEDLKKFMTQLEEFKSLSKPQIGGVTNNQFNIQQFKPRNDLPPFSQRHVPYAPAQNIPKPYNREWVSRQGGGFLFPNWQRVPTDGKISPKKLVEEFAKEQEELTKKRKEKEARESTHQPKEVNIIQAKKNDISTAIAKIEDWGSWQSPTISSPNDPFLNNYGLRNTKKRSSRNEQPSQEPTKSSPKTMETPLKKKPNIPGAYIEDEQSTVEKTIIPTKFKKAQEVKEEEEVIPEAKEKQDSGKKPQLTQNTVKNKNTKQEHTEF
ncbi:hypothetical protein O181_063670 [Austropuccinia psidii MF-1]|uniref:Uncharacterized protein n=1 Tax=Austropuccinia psidii MF-1 TaxID=1389203 RepID=A0A9Q3ERQ5_9BASI|nr:hypothetical protein [Austropuccinia psidii MF-1]